MEFINQDHLRVKKVRTADGQTPAYDENGHVLYKYVLMPLSARKHLEQQNDYKPTPLKMKIEVVKAYRPTAVAPVEDPRIAELQARIKELEAVKPDPESVTPPKQTPKPVAAAQTA